MVDLYMSIFLGNMRGWRINCESDAPASLKFLLFTQILLVVLDVYISICYDIFTA